MSDSMNELSEESVRADVAAWLKDNWDPSLGLVEWRKKLAASGWGVPHWPKQWYGRDLPVKFNAPIEEEFQKIGAVGVAKAGIRTLAAATILASRAAARTWPAPSRAPTARATSG